MIQFIVMILLRCSSCQTKDILKRKS